MRLKIYMYAFGIVLLEAICFIGLLILPFYFAGFIQHRFLATVVLLLLFQPFLLFERYRLGTPWKVVSRQAVVFSSLAVILLMHNPLAEMYVPLICVAVMLFLW